MAEAGSGGAERAIRWTTTLSVILLAAIAALVSYKHMFLLVRRHGEESWTAALLPVSVDGMIAASSMSLLLDSRYGRRSGLLPWALLIIGSTASLAANVAVTEPSVVGRLIAGRPSCALIRVLRAVDGQIRRTAATAAETSGRTPMRAPDSSEAVRGSEVPHSLLVGASERLAGAAVAAASPCRGSSEAFPYRARAQRGGRPSRAGPFRARGRRRWLGWVSA